MQPPTVQMQFQMQVYLPKTEIFPHYSHPPYHAWMCGDDVFHDHDQDGYAGCGTPDPTIEEITQFEARISKYRARSSVSSNTIDGRSSRIAAPRTKLCTGCVKIDVYFHVIEDTLRKSKTSLYLTDSNIAEQIKVLNQHFNSTPFRFQHKLTTRTVNDEWVYGIVFQRSTTTIGAGRATALALRIASTLRMGGPDVVNLFFVDGSPDSICPANFASSPNERGMFPNGTYSARDNIFLCPGGVARSGSPFSYLATSATHEIGHWLGLFHTFAGTSCDPSNLNDLVDDTPQQALPSNNCASCCQAAGRDSCPLLPGKDPSRNFMDYSGCTSEFTPGQAERMYNEFNDVRRRLQPCAKNEVDIRLEIRYDDDPRGFVLNSTSWGASTTTTPVPVTLTVGNSAPDVRIQLVNQTVIRDMCLPKHKVHEFKVFDRNGGLKSPGYFSLSMNGMVMTNVSNFTNFNQTTTSFLVAGDTLSCYPSGRIQLSILFDDNPSAITWRIRRVSDNVVMATEKATLSFGTTSYKQEFARSILFFDRCLALGTYVFIISDASPRPTGSPSYFTLSQGGKEFYRGGTNGGKATESVRFTVKQDALGCFSGQSSVQVAGKGQVALHSVQIGDHVEVENGKFEPIYSFGHYDPNTHGTFLQLHLSNGRNLVISHYHLIFTASDPSYPIAASQIVIGTELIDAHRNKVTVTRITPSVSARGLFAPFTPSGTIVVDGVLASSFLAMDRPSSPFLVSYGGMLKLSHQWLAHTFEFPHRLVCHYNDNNKNYCPTETYEGGIATRLITPLKLWRWFGKQHFVVRGILLTMLAILLAVFGLLELVMSFGNPTIVQQHVVEADGGVMMIMGVVVGIVVIVVANKKTLFGRTLVSSKLS
ncbi:Pregnancy-associated plasma protein-A [Fragilaria crotonensis]|nr:Pregnancy-associated plasma protein-A [Fragilaria crotonensis]